MFRTLINFVMEAQSMKKDTLNNYLKREEII